MARRAKEDVAKEAMGLAGGGSVCTLYRDAGRRASSVDGLLRATIRRSAGLFAWTLLGQSDRSADGNAGSAALSGLAQHAGRGALFSEGRGVGSRAAALRELASDFVDSGKRLRGDPVARQGWSDSAVAVASAAFLCLFRCVWVGADLYPP